MSKHRSDKLLNFPSKASQKKRPVRLDPARSVKSSHLLCPRCESKMLVRLGDFGEFYGCSNFPDCRGTRQIQGADRESRKFTQEHRVSGKNDMVRAGARSADSKRKKSEVTKVNHKVTGNHIPVFHIDGSGSGPDGNGSAFAWVKVGTEKKSVKSVDGLTNNAAEYRGLLALLNYLQPRSRALIFTDSMLVCQQFNQKWAVRDGNLQSLVKKAWEIIEQKGLAVDLKWLPREQNLAGALLEQV